MTDDLKERLLPCPFCGKTPRLVRHDLAACRTLGCAIEHRAIDLLSPAQVEAWNTRALDPRITDLEARLAAAETERDGFRRNLRESFVSPGDAAPPASEPSEYEKKVAQMKEDFPNGI